MMNWMLILSALLVIAGVMIFARPHRGPSTRWLARKLRNERVPRTLADEAVMKDMGVATALIILGGLGLFGLVGPLDVLDIFGR